MNYTWGILGPGSVESVRRVRTLQLAATTRDFNERAVPGLGGVWFGRQLFLATLGLRVAERATARGSRAGKIAVANAIEALACWLAIKAGLGAGERRVRGLCIPRDALTREAHRRLRVRLKFSRRRWAAPG